jgi:hypothetical protein
VTTRDCAYPDLRDGAFVAGEGETDSRRLSRGVGVRAFGGGQRMLSGGVGTTRSAPKPTGRLAFRPVRDTEEVLTLMTLVLDGTLDAHSRDDLTRMSARNT